MKLIKLVLLFNMMKHIVSFKIQHIKTICWTYSWYENHYNIVFIEMNNNPDYLEHNTIMYYNSLYTTLIYK
jgi:hypothetical protein